MKNDHSKLNILTIIVFIALAIGSRFLGKATFNEWYNLAPVNAIALFSGAYIAHKWLRLAIPLLFVWIGDMIINFGYYGKIVPFYDGFYWQYASYILIALVGFVLLSKKVKPLTVLGGALGASVLFFVVSNFGAWISLGLYPLTWEGLVSCYVAAIPFFRQTVASDLVYSFFLFGGFELLKYSQPRLAFSRV